VQKDQLSLQELSAAAGMTARNVRAYQTKGLIPPPIRKGRRSVYGAEHLKRLQAIEHARAKGASLSLIATHLADGRSLDDETLVDWSVTDVARAEIGRLLARLDHQRDAAAQAQVEELIAAGVFRREGRLVFTGRELAEALTVLQRRGLPIAAALGVAQRALQVARPVAESVRATVGADRRLAALDGPLAQVASYVFQQVVTEQTNG
jgi:DNA-binding transcriptional MerR regulator